jgi:hypothetical protein
MIYIYHAFRERISNDKTKADTMLPRTRYMVSRIVRIIFHEHRRAIVVRVSLDGLSILPGLWIGALDARSVAWPLERLYK